MYKSLSGQTAFISIKTPRSGIAESQRCCLIFKQTAKLICKVTVSFYLPVITV